MQYKKISKTSSKKFTWIGLWLVRLLLHPLEGAFHRRRSGGNLRRGRSVRGSRAGHIATGNGNRRRRYAVQGIGTVFTGVVVIVVVGTRCRLSQMQTSGTCPMGKQRRLGRRGEIFVPAPVRTGLVEYVGMWVIHGLGGGLSVADELRMRRLMLVVSRIPSRWCRIRQIAAMVLRVHSKVIVVGHHFWSIQIFSRFITNNSSLQVNPISYNVF